MVKSRAPRREAVRPGICVGLALIALIAPQCAEANEATVDRTTEFERFDAPGMGPRPMTAAAMGNAMAGAYDGLGRAFAWIEIVVPDLRLQTPARVGEGVDALVVSWPVYLWSTVSGSRRSGGGASLFVEPQLPTDRLALRGLGGVRFFGAGHGIGAVLEAGGLVGTDGTGLFAAGGPAIGDQHGMIAAVARRYFVLGEDRWDFTLELSMPTRALTELLGG